MEYQLIQLPHINAHNQSISGIYFVIGVHKSKMADKIATISQKTVILVVICMHGLYYELRWTLHH